MCGGWVGSVIVCVYMCDLTSETCGCHMYIHMSSWGGGWFDICMAVIVVWFAGVSVCRIRSTLTSVDIVGQELTKLSTAPACN